MRNRITRKGSNGFYELLPGNEIYSEEGGVRLIQIVGHIEAIAELCEKIVSKPIFEKFVDTGEIHEENYTDCSALYSFQEKRIELYQLDFVNMLYLKDYGKTWALTRKELENE